MGSNVSCFLGANVDDRSRIANGCVRRGTKTRPPHTGPEKSISFENPRALYTGRQDVKHRDGRRRASTRLCALHEMHLRVRESARNITKRPRNMLLIRVTLRKTRETSASRCDTLVKRERGVW